MEYGFPVSVGPDDNGPSTTGLELGVRGVA
jgi:hypothetical protein